MVCSNFVSFRALFMPLHSLSHWLSRCFGNIFSRIVPSCSSCSLQSSIQGFKTPSLLASTEPLSSSSWICLNSSFIRVNFISTSCSNCGIPPARVWNSLIRLRKRALIWINDIADTTVLKTSIFHRLLVTVRSISRTWVDGSETVQPGNLVMQASRLRVDGATHSVVMKIQHEW